MSPSDTSSSSAAYTPRSDTPPDPVPPRRGRKGHVKSRTGCRTCKRRKIKCDESKPECRNCIRFGVSCDFSPIPLPRHPSPTRRRGRPRSDWSSWPPTTSPRPRSPSPALDIPSLELFHAYLSSSASLAGAPSIWRDAVPRLGLSHPCVFHAMLALAAHHLARTQPLGAPRYLVLADAHYARAVRGATAMLPSLNLENCQALYAAAVLVCFTALARGPGPNGDLLLVADQGVPWLTLMGGVKMVMMTIGSEVVLSGVLKPIEDDSEFVPETLPGERFAWQASLMRVRELLLLEFDDARDMYSAAIDALTGTLESAFGTEENPKHMEVMFHVVMGWVYRLPDHFIEALEARETVALLILGHFAMLLPTLEKRHWFIEGWGSHVLREVKTKLGPTFEGWLP
ncbi:hypothetical protein F5X68DRAFT_260420 [Plectosphaerella plurivora]|uniref:Zn(2)-C6 fungal-type domain-containing protein n=1 Tax=Plectosphaerella plurivora TaxID=936078 RepID=A0A9P9AC44_9PEZI|nr:hypothetical protein F5X68DRAFT_260420 [Plectosphaerella plurivora]